MRYLTKIACFVLSITIATGAMAADQVRTASGTVEGFTSTDKKIRIFEGIPFAAPPIGNLRWRPPQPVSSWSGIRETTSFGPRCMQGRISEGMVFRDPGQSEDCLYLNVWTPARSADAGLPVMVWIYGGGFQAGSASEPRQDGATLAHKGVVVVSMNYRLGVFGFFSDPELTKESPHHASGNYGLLDQAAALQWVHKNIAAFGGDPANVTIFGESAGSISVSAQMASPASVGLFRQAIGESGGVFEWTHPIESLAQSEQTGAAFANSVSAPTLAALRAMPAAEILQAALKEKDLPFWPNVDGYFFRENPWATYAAGKQAHVPLLAGWNADEHRSAQFFGNLEPTKENYLAKVHAEFGPNAPAVLRLFPANTEAEMEQSAHDLASAEFITYSTWKWLNMQAETGDAPVYRYHFEQAPPPEPVTRGDITRLQVDAIVNAANTSLLGGGKQYRGVHHGADIQFVFETLDSENLAWTPNDRTMSDMMSSYWVNFARTGNPNGSGLPNWPRYDQKTDYAGMLLQVGPSVRPHAAPPTNRTQYELLDRIADGRRNTQQRP